jgi:phosphorylcholine metabolism protein LicD
MNNFSKSELFTILDYSKPMQQLILPIFDNFYNICTDNSIPFFMCEGSLLGCVRHQGFVPWDDDIDIYMFPDKLSKFQQYTDSLHTELVKHNPSLYFYKNKKNRLKIDIFVHPFKKHVYNTNNYIQSKFENYVVSIPYNSESILDKLYSDWRGTCYISNHKISIEKYKTWYGYKNQLKNLYNNIPTNVAKDWVEEYEKK